MYIGAEDVAVKWCETHPFLDLSKERFLTNATRTISIATPTNYPRLIALMDGLVSHVPPALFDGALMYMGDWTIWSETATAEIFNRLRTAMSNDPRTLEDAPYTIFEPSESSEFYSLCLLALVANWGATIAPNHGHYAFKFSPWGTVEIAIADEKEASAILEWLEKTEFVVKDVEKTGSSD